MTNSKISRSDIYVRDEKAPEWFNEFLQSFARTPSITQQLMDAMNNKRGETVESVVRKYREMVGLDTFADENESNLTTQASKNNEPIDMRDYQSEPNWENEQSEPFDYSKLEDILPELKPSTTRKSFEGVYKNSPKTIELKKKIDDFSSALSSWNLKYDEFPDIKQWVDKNMSEFPYGQKEIYKYLSDVAAVRSGNYWNTSVEHKTRPRYETVYNILADLAGDEVSSQKPISTRHAQMMAKDKQKDEDKKNVVVVIENDPKLKGDLESMVEHSGGTKNTHSIIHFLRQILGNELISYSDDDLIQYIDDMKSKYDTIIDEPTNVGLIGTESAEYYDDHGADFIEHGKAKQ